MRRSTSDNVFEMNMHQLALNQVYIGQDGWAWYRNGPEDEVSVCDMIRTAAETMGVELPILSDDELSDLLTDWLQYGAKEPEGVLSILYRALWAMAEVRVKLSRYEDAELSPEEATDLKRAWDMYGGEESVTAALQKAAERDAAVEDLRGLCWCCVNGKRWEKAPPWSKATTCDHMRELGVLARSGGKCKCPHWEWRGQQREDVTP